MQDTTPSQPTGHTHRHFVFGIPQNRPSEQKERQVPSRRAAAATRQRRAHVHRQAHGALRRSGKGDGQGQVHRGHPSSRHALRAHDRMPTIPHGRIISIDTSCGRKASRRARRAMSSNTFTDIAELRDPKQETPSRYPVIRYAGQPIAGVAATSRSRSPTTPRSW